MAELKNACSYIRVSTHGRQEELSPDTQKQMIYDYCKSHGYIITEKDIFQDLGISGKFVDKRPAFNQMIGMCKSKEHPYDAVIVWKFSRFARNQEESVIYKRMLKKIGVDVISISEPISDDIGGRIAESIFEIMDEYYSINLSQEVTRGMKENAKRGNYQCRTPYGYKRISKGVYEIVDEEAKLVRYAYEQYALGKGIMTIAFEINQQGFRSRNGRPFERKVVQYWLENPFYCGMIRWNYKDHKQSAQRLNDESEWIISEGKHEPIVSKELWNTVSEKIKANKNPRKSHDCRPTNKHWLAGIVRCANCGRTLTYNTLKHSTDAFSCNGYSKGICSTSQWIKVPLLEKAFIEGLTAFVNDTRYQEVEVEIQNDIPTFDVEHELNNLKNKEKRIKEAYRNGIYSLEELKEEKELLEKEKTRLLEMKIEPKTETKNVSLEVKNVIELLQDETISNVEKNDMLKNIIDKVVFDKTSETLDFSLL